MTNQRVFVSRRIKRLSVLAVRCFGDEPFCMTGWKKGPSRSSSATSSVKSASFESERIRRVTVDVLNKGGPSQLRSQTRQDSRNGQNSSFLVHTSDDEPGPNWAGAGTAPAERHKEKDANSVTEKVDKDACAPSCLCGNEARTPGTDNLGSGPSTVPHINIRERPNIAESNFRKKSHYKRKVSPNTDWVTHEIGIKKSISCVNLADSISRQNDMFRRLSTAGRSSSGSDSDDEKPDTADATVLDANDSKNEWDEHEIGLKKSVSFVDLTESGFHSCYMFQHMPDLQEESSSCEDLAQGSGPKDTGSGATPDEKRLQAEGKESAQPANRFTVQPVDETVPHNLNCAAEENNSHPPPKRPGLRDAGGELLDALTIQVDDLRIGVNSCNGSRGEETRCPVVDESHSLEQKKRPLQKHPESASTYTWGAARDGSEQERDRESHEEVIVATIFGPPPSPPTRTCETRGGDSKTVFADPILFSFSELPLSCNQAQGTRSAGPVRSSKRLKGTADLAGWAGDTNQQNNPTPDDDDDDDDADCEGDVDDIDDGGEDDEDKEEDEEVEEEEEGVDDEDSGDGVVEADVNETQKSESDGQKGAQVSPKKRKAAKSIRFNKRASVMLTPNRFQSLSIAETKAKRKKRMCCCYVPVRNKYQKEFYANLKEAAEIKAKQNTAGNMQDPTQETNQNAQTKVLGKYQPNIPSTSYGSKATYRGPLTTCRESHVSATSEWQKKDRFTSIAPASSGSSLKQAKLHDYDDVSEVDDVGSNVDDVSLTSTDDVDEFLHRERFTGENNFNAKRKLCERRGTFQRAGTADNSKKKQPRQRQHSAGDIRTERLDGQNICTEVRVSPSDCQSFVSAYMDDQNSQEQTENTSARPQKTYPVASEAGCCAKGQDTQTKDEEHAWCGDSLVFYGAAGEGGTGVGICQKNPTAPTKEGGTESGGDDTEKDKGKGICQKNPTAPTQGGGTDADVTDAQTEARTEAAGKKHVTAGGPGDRETRRVDAETEDGEKRHPQEENRVTGSQAWGAPTAMQQLTGPGNNSTCSDDDREDKHADTKRIRDGENGASCAQQYDAKETDFCTEEPASEDTETDTRQRATEDGAKSRDSSASIKKPGSGISHTHAEHWCVEDCHTLTESRDAEDSTYTEMLGTGQSRAYAKNENAENDKQYTENQNPIDASAMNKKQGTRKAVNTSEIHGTESGNRNKLTESQDAEAGKRNELTETRGAEASKRNELTESQNTEAGKRNECTGNQGTEVEDKRNLRENEERVLKKKTICSARNIAAELNEEHHGTLTEKTMYSGNQDTWHKEYHSTLTEKTMYSGNQDTWDKEQHSTLTEKKMYLGNQNTWDKEQHSTLTEKTMYSGNQDTWHKEYHSTLTEKTMYSGNQNTWDKEQHSTLTGKTMYSGNQDNWDKEQHSTLTGKTMYLGNQDTWDKEQHSTLTEKTMYSGNQNTNADVERPSSARSSASWNRTKKGRSLTLEDERSSLKHAFCREPFAVHFLSPSTGNEQKVPRLSISFNR